MTVSLLTCLMSKTMIENQIYDDDWFFELPQEAKFLFIYLITNKNCGLTGCYQVPLKIIATYTGFSVERVQKLFDDFKDKATYKNGWVIIPNYQKHNPIKNPNVDKARDKQLTNTPQWVLDELTRLTQGLPKASISLHGNGNGKCIKEDKSVREETKYRSIDSLTTEVLQEVANEYSVTLQDELNLKIEMELYCKSQGKSYKDYRAAIMNWTRRKLDKGEIKPALQVKKTIAQMIKERGNYDAN